MKQASVSDSVPGTVLSPKTHPRDSCRMLMLIEHSAESVALSYVTAGELVSQR
jgi:hypothetical protein